MKNSNNHHHIYQATNSTYFLHKTSSLSSPRPLSLALPFSAEICHEKNSNIVCMYSILLVRQPWRDGNDEKCLLSVSCWISMCSYVFIFCGALSSLFNIFYWIVYHHQYHHHSIFIHSLFYHEMRFDAAFTNR